MTGTEYHQLKSMGIRFQLNVFSLYGLYGKAVQKRAMTLQKQGMYDYAGTDLHRIGMLENMLQHTYLNF